MATQLQGYKWKVQRVERRKEKRGDRIEKKKMDSSVMNWALTVLMGTLLWGASGSAAPMECNFNSRAVCVHEGRHYTLGESWMEDGCLQCTCLHPVGVGCCETVHRPVDFPAWCEVRVDPLTCKVSLVQASDRRLACTPGDENQDPSHGSLKLQESQDPSHGSLKLQESQDPSHGSLKLPESQDPSHGSLKLQESQDPSHGSLKLQESQDPSHGSLKLPESQDPSHGSLKLQESQDPSHGSLKLQHSSSSSRDNQSLTHSDLQ